MRCCLPENTLLTFKNGKSFRIIEDIGQGASSIVYRAICLETNTEVLLKEYNPNRVNLYRDENGTLHPCSISDEQLFREGAKQFISAYKKQCAFHNDHELMNSTSNIQGRFNGYGTVYIEMTKFRGKSYDKVHEKSLNDLLLRMRSITKVIALYHSKGYLHLDLKPDNIFVLPETCDMVMFFDFDSVVKKADLQKDDTRLAYTRSWAPPELTRPERIKDIAECTDIYSLGMVLFSKLMGRLPNPDEHRGFGHYPFNITTGLLAGASNEVIELLTNIFNKTICRAPQNRWQNAKDLIAALDELIIIANQSQSTSRKKSAHPAKKKSKTKLIGAIAALLLLAGGYAFMQGLSKTDMHSDDDLANPVDIEYQTTAEPTVNSDGFVGYDYNGDPLHIGYLVRIGGSETGDRYSVGTIIGMDNEGYAQVKFDSMYYGNEYDQPDPYYIEDIETKILSKASEGGYIQLVKTDMLQIYIFSDDKRIEPSVSDNGDETQDKYVGRDYFGGDLYIGDTVRIGSDISNYRFTVGTVIACIEPGQAIVEFTDVFDVDTSNALDRYYLDGFEDEFFVSETIIQAVTRTVPSDRLQKYTLTGNESLKAIPIISNEVSDPPNTTAETNVSESPSECQYVVDTIAHNVTMLKSMVITNDGVVYYVDDQYLYCSSENSYLDLHKYFDWYVQNVYLAYDPYLDRVYMLYDTYVWIYDVTDINNPEKILIDYDATPFVNNNTHLGDPIVVFPDSTLLRKSNRLDPINGGITHFWPNNILDGVKYIKAVGDNVVAFKEHSLDAAVIPLTGGSPYKIQLDAKSVDESMMCAVQDGVVFYTDGLGICKFDLTGKMSVIIPQDSIYIKDYQRLDNTNITCLVASQNGRIVFYDYSLQCIRCIAEQNDETSAFFATAFKNNPIRERTVTQAQQDSVTGLYTGTIIRAGALNVREHPSTSSNKITELEDGTNIVIYETAIAEDMVWGHCDLGWVSLSFVDLVPISQEFVDARVVCNDTAIIYTDANRSSVADTYSRMTVVNIYEISGNMARTEHGWISLDDCF